MRLGDRRLGHDASRLVRDHRELEHVAKANRTSAVRHRLAGVLAIGTTLRRRLAPVREQRHRRRDRRAARPAAGGGVICSPGGGRPGSCCEWTVLGLAQSRIAHPTQERHAGGDAGSFRATSSVSSSASSRLSCGRSRAAAKAATMLRRWMARLKIECGRPCEVDAVPPSGPGPRGAR
jgi:hypothetical protein